MSEISATTQRFTDDTSAAASGPDASPARGPLASIAITVLRLGVGWVLLWAGADKLFGLGYPTPSDASVLGGNSATQGYLEFGLSPEAPAYDLLHPLAGNPVIDVLYLLATFGAGLALVLGVTLRIAALGGAALFVLLWFSSLPLEHNPFFDEHLFYAIACLAVAALDDGRIGLGGWWRSTGLVRRAPWLA